MKRYGKSVGVLLGVKSVSEQDIALHAAEYYEENQLSIFDNPFTSPMLGLDKVPNLKNEAEKLKSALVLGLYEGEKSLNSKTRKELVEAMKKAKQNIKNFRQRYSRGPIELFSNLKGTQLKPITIPGFTATFVQTKKNETELSNSETEL